MTAPAPPSTDTRALRYRERAEQMHQEGDHQGAEDLERSADLLQYGTPS